MIDAYFNESTAVEGEAVSQSKKKSLFVKFEAKTKFSPMYQW